MLCVVIETYVVQVSEVTSVENENIILAQKPESVVEETIEEALSPASSSISTDIGSVQHKSTPSTQKSARGSSRRGMVLVLVKQTLFMIASIVNNSKNRCLSDSI